MVQHWYRVETSALFITERLVTYKQVSDTLEDC